MRINAERQAARVRISRVKLAIHEAIDSASEPTTDAEINMALTEILNERMNYAILAETPQKEDD